MNSIESRVLKVLRIEHGIPTESVTHTSALTDLGLDSLDIVEFGMQLEEEFEIELPDDELDGLTTIQDHFDVVEKHYAPQ